VFIVGADNVGSKQMQQIRSSLRGSAGNFIEKKKLIILAVSLHSCTDGEEYNDKKGHTWTP